MVIHAGTFTPILGPRGGHGRRGAWTQAHTWDLLLGEVFKIRWVCVGSVQRLVLACIDNWYCYLFIFLSNYFSFYLYLYLSRTDRHTGSRALTLVGLVSIHLAPPPPSPLAP